MKIVRSQIFNQVRGGVLNSGKIKVWDLTSISVIDRVWGEVRNPTIEQISDQLKNQLCVQVKQNVKL
jgi:hypothetical protein